MPAIVSDKKGKQENEEAEALAAAVKIQALRRGHAGRVEAAKQQAASPIIRRFVSQEQTTRSQTFTSTYVRPMLSSTKFNEVQKWIGK